MYLDIEENLHVAGQSGHAKVKNADRHQQMVGASPNLVSFHHQLVGKCPPVMPARTKLGRCAQLGQPAGCYVGAQMYSPAAIHSSCLLIHGGATLRSNPTFVPKNIESSLRLRTFQLTSPWMPP